MSSLKKKVNSYNETLKNTMGKLEESNIFKNTLSSKNNSNNETVKDTMDQLEKSDIFKNTLSSKNISKNNTQSLSKMNSIIHDNIKQNEDNISSFKNQRTLNNTSSSNSNWQLNIFNSIKKLFTIVFFISLLLLVIVFIFREKIIDFSKRLFTGIKKTSVPSKENNINELDNKIKNADDESDIIKGDDSENYKSGFCYIGKINNKRTCANISDQKYCMSGEFFSTKKLCQASGINKK